MTRLLRQVKYWLLYGDTPGIRDYELTCLQAWGERLAAEASLFLNRQLDILETVHRQSKDKRVVLHGFEPYFYREWSDELLFPLRGDRFAAATVWLTPAGLTVEAPLRADICLYEGRLFSIEFDRPPRTVFRQSQSVNVAKVKTFDHIRFPEVEIVNVKLRKDPMVAEAQVAKPLAAEVLEGWLQEWNRRWKLRGLQRPVSDEERRRILETIDARLPDDYLVVVKQTEGLKMEQCEVLGLTEIDKVVRPDANFYILARIEQSGDLAVMQGNNEGEIHYLGIEGDLPERRGTSFRDAVEAELKRVTIA